MWTWNRFEPAPVAEPPAKPERIRRLGINLGAPGDHLDDSGTLWLEYPFTGGPTPRVVVTSKPETVQWFYRHSSRLSGDGLKWVAASGARGLSELTVQLLADAADAKPYVVRLHFAEPDGLGPGERVFDVSLQDRKVRGVAVGDSLKITLAPLAGSKRQETILCGVEILADGW
jgi:hypothetical protein